MNTNRRNFYKSTFIPIKLEEKNKSIEESDDELPSELDVLRKELETIKSQNKMNKMNNIKSQRKQKKIYYPGEKLLIKSQTKKVDNTIYPFVDSDHLNINTQNKILDIIKHLNI